MTVHDLRQSCPQKTEWLWIYLKPLALKKRSLPWKKDPRLLPNNYPLVERKPESLERSLSKNEEKAKIYNRAIEEYIETGWACPLTKEESQSDVRCPMSDVKLVYYQPHHGVYRPDKPSTPLRAVFDSASQIC